MNVLKKQYAVMGIVNVTPDSFYDGGRFESVDAAVEHGLALASEGADILDIGGASSRPGAAAISPQEESRRVLPVVGRLAQEFKGPVSIDTTSSFVASAALDAGATWINDISAGRFDSAMSALAAARTCTVVLMHSRGTPMTMQAQARYDDVVKETLRELLSSVQAFIGEGVHPDRIVIDPGIGFAKTADQSICLLRNLDAYVKSGYPVLVGTSRKSFIGHITGRNAHGRLYGTLASVAAAWRRGVRIFRVHDVAATVDFLKVLAEIEKDGSPASENWAKR